MTLGFILLGMLFFAVNNTVVDFSPLTNQQTGKPSILYDDQGNEWARFQLDRREPIDLQEMPQHVVQAFLAAEDWQFFSHPGLSIKGIIRSTLVNMYKRRRAQGASTITQQLVKLLFFDQQKTFKRKIKEQFFALLVERQCTKEQILQTYLNNIYFGCGIYGIEAASQRFWGISAKQMSKDQAALLAGIIRSPAHYCPLINATQAQQRRNIILHSMKKLGFITAQEYEHCIAAPLAILEDKNEDLAPHFKEMIRQHLEERLGRNQLYNGGLKIQTTLNRNMQKKAQDAFKKQISYLRENFSLPVEGGLLSIDHATGEIKAMVGGFDFLESKFNRTLQAKRQLGSIIKPLVYACAIEQGKTFADTHIDEPLALDDNGKIWSPNNHTNSFDGQMTLAHALSTSNNIVTIKTLLEVGPHALVDLAYKCHIADTIHPYPSLALGCIDVTLKQATGIIALFANNGIYCEPHGITWVKDRWGNKIIKESVLSERVIESNIAGQVAKVLELGMKRVRAHMKDIQIEADIISKTGTTNDSRTCWFIGATPTVTTGIYIGCDDNSSLGKNRFPLQTAFPIWHSVHKTIAHTKRHFTYDPSLTEVFVHEKTGKHMGLNQQGSIPIFVA